ncbi:hypothetical protein STSP2_00727 [Anaerohalosphaera lusitana]|uniref:Uncharacterized protein n=1 Tax=Anaerohalosphaera lusitana TaxID=1936003 RepID=A0A1U9NI22_9BACT|nr:glycoside hydrolase N-terminal domain-containing protein [Anaerohalosphaera lusitana]AQT67579.1 hypothetical protein STSP2_00727 [Anaerohalosphaera lusitana]
MGAAKKIMTVVLMGVFCLIAAGVAVAEPKPEHGLNYDEPATVWDEAFPLGNGLLGGLVWGDGQPLKISLDRTDLWDLRPVPQFDSPDYNYETMRQWVKEGKIGELHKLYDLPYRNAGPTKIPAGRIELTLGNGATFNSGKLDLADAIASVELGEGVSAKVFVHGDEPFGFIRVTGTEVTPKLVVPAFEGDEQDGTADEIVQGKELKFLGYPAPKTFAGDDYKGYEQQGWGELKFAVALVWEKSGDDWLGVWSVMTNEKNDEPFEAAQQVCRDALGAGHDEAFESHRDWWQDFWAKSSVTVPNDVLERMWYLETYKFGAAARDDAPPITLQGPWTADNGRIPPWKGDYHHDLNTELSYWPSYSGNHLEGESGFLKWLWETKDNAKEWTEDFFGLPGLNVPMTADLNQRQIGGWHQYTHSATTAGWLAHHFYLHWRYSMDREFLEKRAYPWLSETATFYEAITEKTDDGKRTLPLSSSPEINDNRLDAWFDNITNYDLALIRWTFDKAGELAEELGKNAEAEKWNALLGEMPQLWLDEETDKLLVTKDYPLPGSHRHFSHLMAFHPLGLVTWEGGEKDREIIKASLAELEEKGTAWWTGYSFSWLGNMWARARNGEKAEDALEKFATAFCLRNSFHCNGDQSGKGYSRFRYRPFTLEGNFAAAAGLQEMLIQSYSGTIRLFPAVPADWKNASFDTLRTEGAFLVSAEREDGKTERVIVTAEKKGTCRVENPFGSAEYKVDKPWFRSVKEDGGTLVFDCKAGDEFVFTRK